MVIRKQKRNGKKKKMAETLQQSLKKEERNCGMEDSNSVPHEKESGARGQIVRHGHFLFDIH